jgi:hypothetical protein
MALDASVIKAKSKQPARNLVENKETVQTKQNLGRTSGE